MGVTGYSTQRRQVEAHAEVLQVHQDVLQKHAQLHQLQANAREALRADLTDALRMAGRRVDAAVPSSNTFFGRLRWLLTGK